MYLTTTISVVLVLFLIGMECVVFMATRRLLQDTRQGLALTLVLNDQVDSLAIQNLGTVLRSTPFCHDYKYISKEDALNEHIEHLGEDPSSFLGFNPLSAAYEVNLKEEYVVTDSILKIKEQLLSFSQVDEVLYQEDVVNILDNQIDNVSFVLLVIALILLSMSVVLIVNTIRLHIYSKRFIINTMRLVGATPWVIKKPFVKRNVLMGLQASIIALVAIFFTIYACYYRLGIMLIPITLENILIVTSAILSIGVLLTFLTSLFATGKYVRMKVDKMYEI